jgi:hypothetical protein
MDHSNHVRLAAAELIPQILEGATIYGAGDHKVGTIDHVHGTHTAIIDVGGFLGIGAKPVSVPLSDLDFMRDEHGDVHATTDWTKDQLEHMPEHHH